MCSLDFQILYFVELLQAILTTQEDDMEQFDQIFNRRPTNDPSNNLDVHNGNSNVSYSKLS